MEAKKRYVTGFNGLRTLGVLAVILYHLYPQKIQGGFLGVVLFFVLSGYLVTDSLLREYTKTKKIRPLKFWGKRAKRIYPMLLAVFLIVSPYLFFFQQNQMKGLRSNFLSSIFMVQNWWQIQQGSSYFADAAGESPFKHIYYLAIEGQFFIFWPLIMIFLVKVIRSKKHSFLLTNFLAILSLILMIAQYKVGQDPTRVYYGTDTRIFSLLMGASMAFIWPMNKMPAKLNKKGQAFGRNLLWGVLALTLVLYVFMPAQSPVTYYGGLWFVSLLTMLLILLVVHPGLKANKIFSNKLFDYIGSRSYGIYLWQLPVFALVAAKVVNPTSWYNVIWQLVLIFALSEFSYRFIERPLVAYDYSNLWPWVMTKGEQIKQEKWRALPVRVILVSVLVLVSLVMILTSPKSPHDQQVLEARIMEQQKALEAANLKAANARVSTPLKTIAEKYGVDPVVAERASKMQIFAVGDSVMVAGSTTLQEAFPRMTIKAVVGEQVDGGATILAENKEAVEKADAVLIGLGTNGTLTVGNTNYVEKIMEEVGDKPVFWINNQMPRPWESNNNEQLEAMAKKYPNLTIIDWHGLSANQSSWFYSDAIHPKDQGAINYTRLVLENMTKK
ncbi:acyltransferase family protein [Lactococcus petauri]|uniref:acyltransferase family protein n=1 Tax=Lactococcus petauri TaxID=1940789 RepID=UPI0013FE21BF|nr:acyltransferase family protein [Lactococcus petauri]NHI64708.1 acetyltransferase [Lactococcus petauri]